MDLFFHWLSSRGLLMRTFNVIIIPGLKKKKVYGSSTLHSIQLIHENGVLVSGVVVITIA